MSNDLEFDDKPAPRRRAQDEDGRDRTPPAAGSGTKSVLLVLLGVVIGFCLASGLFGVIAVIAINAIGTKASRTFDSVQKVL